jgi:membrane-associated phospholipid phosphatase
LIEIAQRLKLRASECVAAGFFVYVAALAACLKDRPDLRYQPLWILLTVVALLAALPLAERRFPETIRGFRDFLPLGLTLVAFQEMDLFQPARFDRHLEAAWIQWDHELLGAWHLRAAIESLGWLIPFYLELCYLLVYGLGTYCVVVLYLRHRRRAVDRFFVIVLAGTLLAYALFPFFPSQPPRLLFPALDAPSLTTWVRRFNLFILRKATIHESVFPSAHVSSAFAAAWAMFLLLPHRKRYGWGVLVYAVSVSIATIYGRYHYAADVMAGLAVSLVPAALCLWMRFRQGTDSARADP